MTTRPLMALLIVIPLLPGCVGSGHYVTQVFEPSRPVFEETLHQETSNIQAYGYADTGKTQEPVKMLLVGKGTTLLITSLERSDVSDAQTGFVLEMAISAQGAGVVMNTSGVVLRSESGKEYRSKGLLPEHTGNSREGAAKNFATDCVSPQPDTATQKTQNINIFPCTAYCLKIWFDSVPPVSDQPIELKIDGLYETGKRVNVPVMRII